MSDLEKRIEAIDNMTKEIAAIEHDNYYVLEQYKLLQARIQRVRNKYAKPFKGELASEELLRKRIDQWKDELVQRGGAKQKKQGEVKRITGALKVRFLKAMLEDFVENREQTANLQQMVDWCSRKSRGKGAAKILNELGIGDVAIPSTQFFQTTINGNNIKLYPEEAYVTKKPPEPAHFIVKKWKRWLDKEEPRILAGKQTARDRASARKRK